MGENMKPSIRTGELLAVDWGTSRVRVYRLDAQGQVKERLASASGARTMALDDYGVALDDFADDLDARDAPAIICGMAGARDGWRPAPYVACPAGFEDLARAMVQPPGRDDVWIVPGVCLRDGDLGDVMRGEEVQALALDPPAEAFTILAPGTHSKWIRREGDRLTGFRTFMTGELYAAISGGTILAWGMGAPGQDDRAFLEGVRLAFEDPALSALVFQVRVRKLSGAQDGAAAADFLSGLLIGAEIAAGLASVEGPLVVVGTPALIARYALALEALGRPADRVVDSEVAVAAGLYRLWRTLP